jgi:hypothetical protein
MFPAVFRPSSGAQNCTHSIWYMSSLLAAMAAMENYRYVSVITPSQQSTVILYSVILGQ